MQQLRARALTNAPPPARSSTWRRGLGLDRPSAGAPATLAAPRYPAEGSGTSPRSPMSLPSSSSQARQSPSPSSLRGRPRRPRSSRRDRAHATSTSLGRRALDHGQRDHVDVPFGRSRWIRGRSTSGNGREPRRPRCAKAPRGDLQRRHISPVDLWIICSSGTCYVHEVWWGALPEALTGSPRNRGRHEIGRVLQLRGRHRSNISRKLTSPPGESASNLHVRIEDIVPPACAARLTRSGKSTRPRSRRERPNRRGSNIHGPIVSMTYLSNDDRSKADGRARYDGDPVDLWVASLNSPPTGMVDDAACRGAACRRLPRDRRKDRRRQSLCAAVRARQPCFEAAMAEPLTSGVWPAPPRPSAAGSGEPVNRRLATARREPATPVRGGRHDTCHVVVGAFIRCSVTPGWRRRLTAHPEVMRRTRSSATRD